MAMTARCARCDWSCRARDEGDAQDALVSHHNLVHGRRAEPWAPYQPPSTRQAEAIYLALHTPVEAPLERYGVLGPRRPWWRRLADAWRSWSDRPRCTCLGGRLPPVHGGYRPHAPCPLHPRPARTPPPPPPTAPRIPTSRGHKP